MPGFKTLTQEQSFGHTLNFVEKIYVISWKFDFGVLPSRIQNKFHFPLKVEGLTWMRM